MILAVILERTETCDCCLHKKSAPANKKETPEERKARLKYNKEAIIIWYVKTEDGKVTNEKGEPSYKYKKKKYHLDCLLAKLRRDLKKDEDKVQTSLMKIKAARQKFIDDSRKKGMLTSSEMENAKTIRNSRERLVNYLMGHYATSSLTRKVLSLIKNLNDGNGGEMISIPVPYEQLLDMLIYYEDDLSYIAKNKQKQGKGFINPSQHILYDISCVIANIDEYNNRATARYTQQAQQDERGEILDVKKYRLDLQNRNNQSEKEVDDSMKRALEFADEYTKEYEEDKYNYGIFVNMFDDE